MKQRTLSVAGLLSIAIALLPHIAHAQATGTITGTVVDAATGEPVIRATVQLVGTKMGALTNTAGSFTIRNVPPGAYTIKTSYVGYAPRTVGGIRVEGGSVARQDISLAVEAVRNDTLIVTARATTTTENALLAQQRKSAAVSDGITSENVRRTGDRNAGESVKRVTGISVVDGKYVFVRGLGERYSNTQLNGVSIPSPEPEKKVVPFDIFPAGMIENIVITKTFSPDQPGTSSGGLIQIKTKEFPEELTGAVTISGGYNSQSQFKSVPVYRGGSLDFLGFDNGTRGLPAGMPTGENKPTSATSAGYNAQVASLLSNQWSPEMRNLPINQGFSISVGNQSNLLDMPLGYVASLSYANDWSHRVEEDRFPLPAASGPGNAYDLSAEKSIFSVNWGALLNLTAQVNEQNKVSLKSLYNRSADDETRLLTGADALYGDAQSVRLRFVARSLFSSTLSGEHYLEGLNNLLIDWKASFSDARRDEPDNREALYTRSRTDGELHVAQRQSRFFSDLKDQETNLSLNFSLPFGFIGDQKAKLKVGGLYVTKSRDFAARRYFYTPGENYGDANFTRVEDFTTAENIAGDVTNFQDLTRGSDAYGATERNLSGYGMLDMMAGSWRLVGGVRVEDNRITISSATGNVAPYTPIEQTLNTVDLLPSINLIYSVNEAMNLRLGYGGTVARPELRELAPFRFDDYRRSTFGNPFLATTSIDNYDFRWEWFPDLGEMVAVSFFYKYFDRPIENILLPDPTTTADIRPIGTANSKSAFVYGTELEVRQSLGVIAPLLAPFSLSVNLTALKSEITQGDTVVIYAGTRQEFPTANGALVTNLRRPLQGQSPYVVNINLSYNNPITNTGFTLLYNVSGSRLRTVGTTGFDDIYEQSRNQVDLSISQIVFNAVQAKLSVKNLLDDDYAFKLGDTYTSRYKTGRSFSIGLSYTL